MSQLFGLSLMGENYPPPLRLSLRGGFTPVAGFRDSLPVWVADVSIKQHINEVVGAERGIVRLFENILQPSLWLFFTFNNCGVNTTSYPLPGSPVTIPMLVLLAIGMLSKLEKGQKPK